MTCQLQPIIKAAGDWGVGIEIHLLYFDKVDAETEPGFELFPDGETVVE